MIFNVSTNIPSLRDDTLRILCRPMRDLVDGYRSTTAVKTSFLTLFIKQNNLSSYKDYPPQLTSLPYFIKFYLNEVIRLAGKEGNYLLLRLFCLKNKVKIRFSSLYNEFVPNFNLNFAYRVSTLPSPARDDTLRILCRPCGTTGRKATFF